MQHGSGMKSLKSSHLTEKNKKSARKRTIQCSIEPSTWWSRRSPPQFLCFHQRNPGFFDGGAEKWPQSERSFAPKPVVGPSVDRPDRIFLCLRQKPTLLESHRRLLLGPHAHHLRRNITSKALNCLVTAFYANSATSGWPQSCVAGRGLVGGLRGKRRNSFLSVSSNCQCNFREENYVVDF